MYNFSKEAKERIDNNKIVKCYLKVLATDTKPEIIINEKNYLKNLKLEDYRYVPKEGFIGQTVAKRVTGNLTGINIQDREFELYLGVEMTNGQYEYQKYGNFIVQKPKDNQVNDNSKFEALDYMVKLNLPWENTITYPCTLKQLFDNLVAQTGLKTKVTSFLNQDFIVENNQFEPGTTRRQVLKAIAQMAFNWARIDEDNEIVMDFKLKDIIDKELTIDNYLEFEKQNEFGPVNVVVLRNSQVEGENFTIRDELSIKKYGETEIVIEDNPFAYTQDKREKLVQAGKSLFGFKYTPVKLKSIGYIYLNCKDKIRINNLKGEKFDTYLFNHAIDYNGVALDSIESAALTKTETKYQFTAPMKQNTRRTEILVDKADQKIEGIIEQIGDRSNKSTSITADIDGISSKVEDIEDLTVKVEGNNQILLKDSLKGGQIVELHIYGSNYKVKKMFPKENLYPKEDLYPTHFYPTLFGNSTLFSKTTIFGWSDEATKITISIKNEKDEEKIFGINLSKPLKQKDGICDEYILKNGIGKIIRRIDDEGNIKPIPSEEIIGELIIPLFEGNNIVSLQGYESKISVVYVPKNNFTETFATNIELKSQIKQTSDEISLEVSKKVGDDEIVSKINQSAEKVQIDANKISLNR